MKIHIRSVRGEKEDRSTELRGKQRSKTATEGETEEVYGTDCENDRQKHAKKSLDESGCNEVATVSGGNWERKKNIHTTLAEYNSREFRDPTMLSKLLI